MYVAWDIFSIVYDFVKIDFIAVTLDKTLNFTSLVETFVGNIAKISVIKMGFSLIFYIDANNYAMKY